jgi:hypothetical protein
MAQVPGAARQNTKPAEPVAQTADAGDRLPVKRVVLYKSGVGFFEHVGRVRGNGQVTIDFTSGQLNDVLKSLTTVDLGDGKVTGVSFNTDDSASRKLGGLGLPLDEETSVTAFLAALKGARVEAQTPAGLVSGRVLSVETRTRDEAGKAVEVRELGLVSDAGVLQTVEVSPRMSLRVLDGDLRGDIRRYLDIAAAARRKDERRMTISTAGSGERPLYVSYISEVPIWKSTYRLVLPAKAGEKPLLQGWAIVDNTIGEDWDRVELSLVAGAPQSFIQQLSLPLYARRPVIPLPSAMQLSPQTHEATLQSGTAAVGAPAETTSESDFRAPAMRFAGNVAAMPMAPPPAPAPAMMAREAMADVMERTEAAAEGHELGDLFEYRLKEPVTIRKSQSALVPILNGRVEAERVSVWNASTGARPRAAVWFTNSTSYTLDGGSVSVLEDGTFTGEGLIDAVKPGERRLLSYAADLALLVDVKQDAEPERAMSVRASRGLLILQRELREKRTYSVRNEDSRARTLVVEHPNRGGWQLTSAAKPEETAPNNYRFKVPVGPKATATLVIDEKRVAETTYRVTNLSDDQIGVMVKERSLTPEAEQALRAVLGKKNEVAAVAGEIDARRRETAEIFKDQERLRENLKALGSKSEERTLAARYTRQLDEQETRLEVLKREVAERETRRRALQVELDALVQNLSFGK